MIGIEFSFFLPSFLLLHVQLQTSVWQENIAPMVTLLLPYLLSYRYDINQLLSGLTVFFFFSSLLPTSFASFLLSFQNHLYNKF